VKPKWSVSCDLEFYTIQILLHRNKTSENCFTGNTKRVDCYREVAFKIPRNWNEQFVRVLWYL